MNINNAIQIKHNYLIVKMDRPGIKEFNNGKNEVATTPKKDLDIEMVNSNNATCESTSLVGEVISIEEARSTENSDVQLLEATPDSKNLSNSVEIISGDGDSSLVVLNVSDDVQKVTNDNSSDLILKNTNRESNLLFRSPYPILNIERINFDESTAFSTPNENEKVTRNVQQDIVSSTNVKYDSTESLIYIQPLQKTISLYVEVCAQLHMEKYTWTGEFLNIFCNEINEKLSGYLADSSKSASPSSSTVSSNLPHFSLKQQNRFSVVSSSSSSSMASSASALARLRERKSNKEADIQLTEERINELKSKWLNSNELFKILDFIDNIFTTNTQDSTAVAVAAAAAAVAAANDDDDGKNKSIENLKENLSVVNEVCTPVNTSKVREPREPRKMRQAKVKFAPEESDNNVIPKKRNRRTVECEEGSNPVSSNFSPGDSVFAKWVDRKFYAATLGKLLSDGKWEVHFYDGDKKTLFEEYLIKAEEFIMVGHSVYASQDDNNFTPGIITGCELIDNVLQYNVVRDKGDISIPYHSIYITESQARQIRGKPVANNTSSTIQSSKSNQTHIVNNGKISTRSKTRQLQDSPKPGSSGTQTRVPDLSDSDDEHDSLNEINLDDVSGVEPESHGIYENGIKLKGKMLTGKMRFSRTKDNTTDVEASILGPVPEEGSKYFKNLRVLLTCTRPQSPKLHHISDTNNSGSAVSTDSETYNFTNAPFVRDRLKLQLEMGGAVVYNNIDDIPPKMRKNTYLISNRPNLSAKYIQCIAAGIKCVCHEWVIRCCREKKRLSLQELPLGWSLEKDRYINSFDKKSTNLLKKFNLLIAEPADKSFYKFWSKVCKLADMNVQKLTIDSDLQQVDAVLSELGYRDDNIDRVLSHNISLVTTTWLVQSLINGEPRLCNSHKTYMADYIDSD